MSPAVAGGLVTGVALAYAPTLRDQIRSGEVSVPFGTIDPIRVRRNDHPLAFRVCAALTVLLTAALIGVGTLMIVRALA